MGQKVSTKRRLAFVIHDMNSWGGQDRSTLEIARRLSRKWPIDVYSFTLENKEARDAGGLSFHPVGPNVARPVLVKSLFFYANTLLPLWLMPKISRSRAPLIHATGACSLVSDIIHVQFIHAAWRDAPMSLLHDSRGIYQNILRQFNLQSEKKIFTKQKIYIAISNSVARDLHRYYGIEDGIRVIHHGVDSKEFHPSAKNRKSVRASLKISSSELMIVFVGAFERKGLSVSIDALARLSVETRARVKLIAIGSGDRTFFEAHARNRGVRAHVEFVEHTREILPYYQAADIFLLPTIYEPFGLVIVEAMACALPCVVSACAGASELLKDQETGSLIQNPLNVSEVAARLEQLILNENMRRKMADNARQVAEGRSWDTVAEEYADFLEPWVTGEQES